MATVQTAADPEVLGHIARVVAGGARPGPDRRDLRRGRRRAGAGGSLRRAGCRRAQRRAGAAGTTIRPRRAAAASRDPRASGELRSSSSAQGVRRARRGGRRPRRRRRLRRRASVRCLPPRREPELRECSSRSRASRSRRRRFRPRSARRRARKFPPGARGGRRPPAAWPSAQSLAALRASCAAVAHLRRRCPGRGGDAGGDCALDERRVGDDDPFELGRGELFLGRADSEHRASEIHQDDGPRARCCCAESVQDLAAVGSERPIGSPTDGYDRHLVARDLADELRDSFRDRSAVRDENETDIAVFIAWRRHSGHSTMSNSIRQP